MTYLVIALYIIGAIWTLLLATSSAPEHTFSAIGALGPFIPFGIGTLVLVLT